MTHPLREQRLSPQQRFLRAVGAKDRNVGAALAVILSTFEFEHGDDGQPLGHFLLRKMGVTIPASETEHEAVVVQATYQRAAIIAFAVALTETGDGAMLFRRAHEVFNTLYGSAYAIPSTRSFVPPEQEHEDVAPTDEEVAAVLLSSTTLMPSGELAALWRIWNGEPYPSRRDPKEYEREKKIRHRARKRIVQLREAHLMAQAVEALHRFLAERDERIEERVYERVVKRLGLDAAVSFQAYLAGREDEAREALFREPFEDVRYDAR
jgi:hypothetical protein